VGTSCLCRDTYCGIYCDNYVCSVANSTTGFCVECRSNTQCQGKAATPVCDVLTFGCVQCLNSANCLTGFGDRKVCSAQQCVECTSNANCNFNAAKTKCNTQTNTCQACLVDGDCTTPGLGFCDNSGVNATFTCKQCTANEECPAGDNRTCFGFTCVDCRSDAECLAGSAAPRCDLRISDCVECLASTDCTTTARPACQNTTCV
jgi:hypothetical protein